MPPLSGIAEVQGRCQGSADLELAGLDPDVDLDHPVAHADRVGVHRVDGGKGLHLPAEEVEPRAVTGTLDAPIVELALAEGAAVVGADVVDSSPLTIRGPAECERAALGADHRDLTRREVAFAGDR